jgi:hypothetical protein
MAVGSVMADILFFWALHGAGVLIFEEVARSVGALKKRLEIGSHFEVAAGRF